MRYLSRIASLDNLKSAYRHIAASRGGAGSDAVTPEEFAEHLEERLSSMAEDLMADSYRFQPALAIELTEKDRTVFVLTVRDRVVMQAIAQIVAEPLEKFFHRASYAYQPGKSAIQASIDIFDALKQGAFAYVLRCDVRHYFDTVDHAILGKFMEWALGDHCERTPVLILRAVKLPCLLEGSLRETTRGICQGSPLSPLLSNLYLTPFDRYLEKLGARHFRFCDDIAILLHSPEEAESLWQEMEKFLWQQLKLRLHPEKRQLAAFADGFDFLGFHYSPQGRVPGRPAHERLCDKLAAIPDRAEQSQAVRRWEAFYGKGSFARAYHTDVADHRRYEGYPRIIHLLLDLFRGNPACFAHAFKGLLRYGYAPVLRPLTGDDLMEHILGKETLGIYLLNGDRLTCSCLDLDLDKAVLHSARQDPSGYLYHRDLIFQHARRLQTMLRDLGLDALLEDSGYKGYHLWLCFGDFVPAREVIAFWKKVLLEPAPARVKREIFPREAIASGGRFGSLVKLPLALHPQTRQRSMFVSDNGEPVINPEAMLAGVRKTSLDVILKFLEKVPMPESNGEIERLLAGCHVVSALCDKARREHDLGHFERCILLYTLGQLGKEGEKHLHYIMSRCSNYNYHITQCQIEKKKASPMGCRRIQEIMGEALNNLECRCAFEIPDGGYASPMLHVYPNATKNLGGRKGR